MLREMREKRMGVAVPDYDTDEDSSDDSDSGEDSDGDTHVRQPAFIDGDGREGEDPDAIEEILRGMVEEFDEMFVHDEENMESLDKMDYRTRKHAATQTLPLRSLIGYRSPAYPL